MCYNHGIHHTINPTSKLFMNTQIKPSACHITNNQRVTDFKVTRNYDKIAVSDLPRKTVENCSHIEPSTERGRSCVGQIYMSCPTVVWRSLNFTLTWRRKSTAECLYDTRTSRGCSTGRPWTSANFLSLQRPSYAGMVCNAHFKPVLGK